MVYGGTKMRWDDGIMVYGGTRYDGINNLINNQLN